MAKTSKNFSACLVVCLLLIGFILFKCFNTSTREGVVFTRYDNRKLFTKPWDNFCLPSAPSCQKPFLEKPGMIGVFPVGCWCKGMGQSKSPPAVSEKCHAIDHNYFYDVISN